MCVFFFLFTFLNVTGTRCSLVEAYLVLQRRAKTLKVMSNECAVHICEFVMNLLMET